MYFEYGDAETEYLKTRDPFLAAVVERTGHIYRETDPDIFSAVVHQIIGQQISSKAQATVWERLHRTLGRVDAGTVAAAGAGVLQSTGMSQRKAECVVGSAEKVLDGSFDTRTLEKMMVLYLILYNADLMYFPTDGRNLRLFPHISFEAKEPRTSFEYGGVEIEFHR